MKLVPPFFLCLAQKSFVSLCCPGLPALAPLPFFLATAGLLTGPISTLFFKLCDAVKVCASLFFPEGIVSRAEAPHPGRIWIFGLHPGPNHQADPPPLVFHRREGRVQLPRYFQPAPFSSLLAGPGVIIPRNLMQFMESTLMCATTPSLTSPFSTPFILMSEGQSSGFSDIFLKIL